MTPDIPLSAVPVRLQRSRKLGARTPAGAIYVGRPTRWGNPFPFQRFGQARCVKLHRAWLWGELSHPRITCLGFNEVEAEALRRWRFDLLARIGELTGHDLQCWCSLATRWCHADTLLCLTNTPLTMRRLRQRVAIQPMEMAA